MLFKEQTYQVHKFQVKENEWCLDPLFFFKFLQQNSQHGSYGYSPCLCAPGIPGIPGSPGPAGPAGTTGSPGNNGPKGSMGPRGVKGDEGPRGKQGLPGTKGDTGSRGPAGSLGSKGDAGPPGSQGPPGPKGPQGPSGQAVRNWKQCVFKNLNDDRDSGLVKVKAKVCLRIKSLSVLGFI